MATRILIPEEDIDVVRQSLRLDLLTLPYSSVESVYVNGKAIEPKSYRVIDNSIELSDREKLKKTDDVRIYFSAKSKRINFERYTTIIVAIIGLLGTILSVILQPEWIHGETPLTKLVEFEADEYGVDRTNKNFRAILRWEEPSEKNATFDEAITRLSDAWAFVRIRDNLVDVHETEIQNVIGPLTIRNGMVIEMPVDEAVLQKYEIENKWLQLIVLAVPKGQKVVNGQKIRDLGLSTKILLSPAVKPTS